MVQSQGRGEIQGVVRDPDGAPLPGVRVVAVNVPGDEVRRPQVSVRAAEDGTYTLHPRPGIFEVRAELLGFCAGGRPRVRVADSETQTVDFNLRLRPIEQAIFVVFPLPEKLTRAHAVVHMRIARSHEPRLMIPDIACGNGNVFVEHELQVLDLIKADHPRWPDAERVLFVQPRAGTYMEGQETIHGPQTPYAIGDEYVAFLHWSPQRQRFQSSAAPNAMIPVRAGRIAWRGSGEHGVRDGMPVAAFLERLRELRD